MVKGAAAEVEDLLEGASEVAIEGRVNDRVEKGVGIAEPEEKGGQGVWDGPGVTEERADQGQHEKGQPADSEGGHDDAQCGGGLPLLGQLEPELPGGACRLRGQPAAPAAQHRALRLAADPRHTDGRAAALQHQRQVLY